MGRCGSFEGGASASGKGCSRTRARRAALYATARVALGSAGALGLALAACGGKTTGEEGAAGLDGHGEDAPITSPDSSGGNAPTSAGGASGGSAPITAGGATATAGGTSGARATGAGLVCAGPFELTQPPQPGPSDAEFACCVDYVVTSISSPTAANSAGQSDPALDNCCRLIIAGVEADYQRGPASGPTTGTCCRFGDPINSHYYRMCAPWGPPVPPAIDWEAA